MSRDGCDILSVKRLTFSQMALGSDIEIDVIDGRWNESKRKISFKNKWSRKSKKWFNCEIKSRLNWILNSYP